MICERCGQEFTEDWRTDKHERTKPCRFCSPTCSRARSWSSDSIEKRRQALLKRYAEDPKPSKSLSQERYYTYKRKTPEELIQSKVQQGAARRSTALQKYLATPFEELGMENKRRRVFEEQGYKCNRCGNSEWQGQQIPLELEHKDGNHGNNARENLEGLCPNCHAISPTWRGRNKGNYTVSNEELLQALQETESVRQALLRVGLSAKGGNYHRAYNLLEQSTRELRD